MDVATVSLTITAVNARGEAVPSYAGTVHVTSDDAKAVLPGDLVFAAADAGKKTASFTARTAGTVSIIAADAEFGSQGKRSGDDEQEGFKLIFMGAMTGVRNPKAHALFEDLDEERLVHLEAVVAPFAQAIRWHRY